MQKEITDALEAALKDTDRKDGLRENEILLAFRYLTDDLKDENIHEALRKFKDLLLRLV